jgi:hypothetical protein
VEKVISFTAVADGPFNSPVVFYSTLQGLDSALIYVKASTTITFGEGENTNIAATLRERSGLPVDALAHVAGVSRAAFHKWLAGRNISEEHSKRIADLLPTLDTLRNLLGPATRGFLIKESSIGRPIDLLAAGDTSAVLGLALRLAPTPQPPPVIEDSVRQLSGLPGWIRPTSRLAWDVPTLSEAERDKALNELSPDLISEETVAVSDENQDDDSVFSARGLYME